MVPYMRGAMVLGVGDGFMSSSKELAQYNMLQ